MDLTRMKAAVAQYARLGFDFANAEARAVTALWIAERTPALVAEVEALRSAILSHCQCRWATQGEQRVQVEECHWHQCQRSVLLNNGDPSDVTLSDEIERLRAMECPPPPTAPYRRPPMPEYRIGLDGDQPYVYLPEAVPGKHRHELTQRMWFLRRLPADMAQGILHRWQFTNAEDASRVVVVTMSLNGVWGCSCGEGEDCKFLAAARTLLRVEKPLLELMESSLKKGQP